MWQPNRGQWPVIWAAAALIVLAWPPESGRSLLVKAVNRAADPRGTLPALPPPLPMSLGDNGDAVAATTRRSASSTPSTTGRGRRGGDDSAGGGAARSFDRAADAGGVGRAERAGVWRLNGQPRRIDNYPIYLIIELVAARGAISS